MAKKAQVKGTSRTGQLTREGFLSTQLEAPDTPDYVVVELRYESPVAYSTKFAAPAAAAPQADTLNNVLEKYDIKAMRSHFGLQLQGRRADRRRSHAAAGTGAEEVREERDGHGVHPERIRPDRPEERAATHRRSRRELNEEGPVWKAFVAPRPVPAVASGSRGRKPQLRAFAGLPLFTPPNGIGAMEVWASGGAKGKGVTICDIEGNWNRSHEDLPSGISLIGGTVINDLGWRNHGTAVLGEMISMPTSGAPSASATPPRRSSTRRSSTAYSTPPARSPMRRAASRPAT